MPVKIGYWNMRGVSHVWHLISQVSSGSFKLGFNLQFGEPIRLLLAYTGTQVEDKRYNWIKSKSDSGEWYGSQWDGSEWYGEKFTHGFDFPNVMKLKIEVEQFLPVINSRHFNRSPTTSTTMSSWLNLWPFWSTWAGNINSFRALRPRESGSTWSSRKRWICVTSWTSSATAISRFVKE